MADDKWTMDEIKGSLSRCPNCGEEREHVCGQEKEIQSLMATVAAREAELDEYQEQVSRQQKEMAELRKRLAEAETNEKALCEILGGIAIIERGTSDSGDRFVRNKLRTALNQVENLDEYIAVKQELKASTRSLPRLADDVPAGLFRVFWWEDGRVFSGEVVGITIPLLSIMADQGREPRVCRAPKECYSAREAVEQARQSDGA